MCHGVPVLSVRFSREAVLIRSNNTRTQARGLVPRRTELPPAIANQLEVGRSTTISAERGPGNLPEGSQVRFVPQTDTEPYPLEPPLHRGPSFAACDRRHHPSQLPSGIARLPRREQ